MRKFFRLYKSHDLTMHHTCDSAPLTAPGQGAFGMHAHDNCEIYHFLSGDCSYIVEGRCYSLTPGCIMLMRPAEIHCLKIGGNSDYERMSVNLSADTVRAVDPAGLLMEPFYHRNLGELNLYTPADLPAAAGAYLSRAAAILEHKNEEERRLVILANLLPLLCELRDSFRRKKQGEDPSCLKPGLLEYINSNLADNLSLDTLGELFHLSKSQLNRQFRRLTGTTIGEYVSAKRLLSARERILSGEGATDASRECGFHDYSAFYRAYKKKYGLPPTASARRQEPHPGGSANG